MNGVKFSFLIAIFSLCESLRADSWLVSIDGPSLVTIRIEGEINQEDMKFLERTHDLLGFDKKKPIMMLDIDSEGGNLAAALDIGEYARKMGAYARVEREAQCLSSCVFILAGAPNRIIYGKVGIHRPFDPVGVEGGIDKVNELYSDVRSKVVGFLERMNIDPKLYDTMIRTPPHSMRILSHKEMEQYGLSLPDPHHDEARDTAEAQRLGITRAEYAKRVAQSEADCWKGVELIDMTLDQLRTFAECEEDIMKGK